MKAKGVHSQHNHKFEHSVYPRDLYAGDRYIAAMSFSIKLT